MKLRQIEGVELRAFCDASDERARNFSSSFGTDSLTFSDFTSMLEHARLDAVCICTPHALHHRQIVDSLDKGWNVLVEKPMVTSTAEARDVLQKLESSGKVLLINYPFRYFPNYRYARELIRSGELGEPEYIEALVCQDWVRRITESRRVWRFNPRQSGGGMLIDTGSHLIDIIPYLTGLQPLEVFALVEKKDKAVDIFSSISVRYANGALGTISTVGNAGFRWQVWLWLTRGAILLDESKVLVGRGEDGRYELVEVPEDQLPPPMTAEENFVNAVLGGEEPIAGVQAGLKAALFTDAIYRSASMRALVTV